MLNTYSREQYDEFVGLQDALGCDPRDVVEALRVLGADMALVQAIASDREDEMEAEALDVAAEQAAQFAEALRWEQANGEAARC